MKQESRKLRGAYYTPESVVSSLVQWAVREEHDRLLDPSCGDGRFLVHHRNSVGVEFDAVAAASAHCAAPHATIHCCDFFDWAASTAARFDCAAGNPPFIRYQRFTGETRRRAIQTCRALGVEFSQLASSWAPFLVATAGLLKPGGRMAFVVPAEIGHAPYARPLMRFLMESFGSVRLLAIRRKLFPELSEDAWLLYAERFGERGGSVLLAKRESFSPMRKPPRSGERVGLREWEAWNERLRPFLLPSTIRSTYLAATQHDQVARLGDVARVGIGYVTGANEFFHLRPSEAESFGIPKSFLMPTVRSGRTLSSGTITKDVVHRWRENDEPNFLLRLRREDAPPRAVLDYLETPDGLRAREGYKCRNRSPWYAVPDVTVPDAFLGYMSGNGPQLVANHAACACSNSVHAVRFSNGVSMSKLAKAWRSPTSMLSCELEGHPLGGGMLKLEPREAARVVLPLGEAAAGADSDSLLEGLAILKSWRHHGL